MFPGQLWMAVPDVGLTLFGMQTLRITHPPSGAIPVLTLQMPGNSVTLLVRLVLAIGVHRLPPCTVYPAPKPGLPVQTPAVDSPKG